MTLICKESPMIGLLLAALDDPIKLSRLLQQRQQLREIMNDIPARQWLYREACQVDDLNRAKRVQDLIVLIMRDSRLIWCGGDVSRDIYDEALSRTYKWFTENFQKYNPEKASFVTWFNKNLEGKIKDVLREQKKEKERRYYPPNDEENDEWIYRPAPDPDRWYETIQEWLELVKSDPKLLECRMQNHPHVNCRILLIDILEVLYDTEDFCWDDLAQRYSLEASTLRRFCKTRCFRIFKQLLSEIILRKV